MVKKLSWMALYPELYESERRLIEEQHDGLKLCDACLSGGMLAYHGWITVNESSGVSHQNVFLLYPEVFPYRIPHIIPIKSLPGDEPHKGWSFEAEIISARHQMNDGNLCLVEEDPFREAAGVVRGIDVIRRARIWFFGVRSGHNPHDSLEADLQSHFRKLGDILIGPEFYGPEMRRGGQFFAARLLDPYSPRFVALGLSSDRDDIPVFKDSRRSLEKPFPWIQTSFWDVAQLVAAGTADFKEKVRDGIIIKGYWWDLDHEPNPPRTGGDVIRLVSRGSEASAIEQAMAIFSGDILTDQLIQVGLRFPDRRGGYDWLFLVIVLREKRETNPVLMTAEQKMDLLNKSRVGVLHRHGLITQELSLRNERRVPRDLASRSISMLGTGALGSQVADLLVKAGLGSAELYDKDIITVGNVSRHQCGIESFGLRKVESMALHLIQHNPFLDLKLSDGDLSSSFESIGDALSGSDFAISSMADESVESAVNQIAVTKNKTVYYVRVMRGGTVGRFFRVLPGHDACRHCISRFLQNYPNDEMSRWLHVPETEDSLLGHECGNPIIAGSAADLSIVASLATRIILDEMMNGFGDNNHWLWSSQAIFGHEALSEPFRLASRRVLPDPRCPFCSDPPVTRVLLPAHIEAQIEAQAITSGENETGGILVGYFADDLTAVVTDASDAGPNAESSPTHFSRDIEHTQEWLEKSIRAATRPIEYIGEWHSHPSEDTNPSLMDISSLTGIAKAENYLCSKPVALILGCVNGEIVSRSAYSFASDRPFRSIGYVIEDR
jgi:integrative and conjugative element protein (TIGR02256 family)